MNLSTIERVSGAVLLIASALLLVEVSGPQYAVSAADEGVNPGFFPKVLLSFWVILALILVARPPAKGTAISVHVDWRKFAVFAAMTVGYFAAVLFIGFVLATGVFLCLCPIFLGFRPYWGGIVFGIVSTAALWVLFAKIFRLVLPVGQLWE